MPIDLDAISGSRRRGQRTALRLACTAVLPGDVQRSVVSCDLGAEGLSFLSAVPMAPGTRCRLSFDLPQGASSVTVRAQVKTLYSSFVASRSFRIGAVFTELDAASATALRDYLALDA